MQPAAFTKCFECSYLFVYSSVCGLFVQTVTTNDRLTILFNCLSEISLLRKVFLLTKLFCQTVDLALFVLIELDIQISVTIQKSQKKF